ncbi:MAG: ATP-binding cassette domain-containing protein, partial [Anaerolineaceae bacterium]
MNDGFISTADLKKYYKMGETEVRALDGISLEIDQGSFTIIMGPSGSGKSTLLNLIGGLDWPTSGSIRVDGEEIATMDENALAAYRRNKLGFIFQSFNLVSSMTAEENVGFPLRFSGIKTAERKERAREMLAAVGLEERVGHKP